MPPTIHVPRHPLLDRHHQSRFQASTHRIGRCLIMSTTKSFRAKFRVDFQSAMRPTTGSKNTHLSWFLPLCVFIDLFYVSDSIERTTAMYIVKFADDNLCSSLMDGGWDSKISTWVDIVKTTMAHDALKLIEQLSMLTSYITSRRCFEIQLGKQFISMSQWTWSTSTVSLKIVYKI